MDIPALATASGRRVGANLTPLIYFHELATVNAGKPELG